MQFKTLKTRRVTIRKMNKKDYEEYQTQLKIHNTVKDDKINKKINFEYLTILNEDKKMIGIIQVDDLGDKQAYIEISVPNDAWNRRYGTEALHQFIKCCEERKIYKKLYLKAENTIVQKYKKERPNKFEENESNKIRLKIA